MCAQTEFTFGRGEPRQGAIGYGKTYEAFKGGGRAGGDRIDRGDRGGGVVRVAGRALCPERGQRRRIGDSRACGRRNRRQRLSAKREGDQRRSRHAQLGDHHDTKQWKRFILFDKQHRCQFSYRL